GGSADDAGQAIAADSAGNTYVTGYTLSTNFPTAGAVQLDQPNEDLFFTKFDAAGHLVSSTYLGGGGADFGNGIAVDAAGNVYLTGPPPPTDSPPTAGVVGPALRGGSDALVVKLNAAGNGLLYATYLGGSANDVARGLVVDASGAVSIAGETSSTDFP